MAHELRNRWQTTLPEETLTRVLGKRWRKVEVRIDIEHNTLSYRNEGV
jgi:hypothetical protein